MWFGLFFIFYVLRFWGLGLVRGRGGAGLRVVRRPRADLLWLAQTTYELAERAAVGGKYANKPTLLT